ncbi:unnamed protein product [Ostreobium quekettii]|uniref:Uncharacterized protein n=1 Tax=Ostreobium quekettii TaxID=121088 RepID=A0A8S1J1A4_9CHLO|nr:unnamed protein product [Ostreobium quekettii]
MKRDVQREIVKDWKRAKEEERKRQEARARERYVAAKRSEEECVRARQRANGIRLEEYKRQKAAERQAAERAVLTMKAMNVPQPPSPQTAARLRQRSDALVKRRQEAAEQKERDRRDRENRALSIKRQVSISVERDPVRVLKDTALMKMRKAAARLEELKPRDSGYIRNVQHKAQPVWIKAPASAGV